MANDIQRAEKQTAQCAICDEATASLSYQTHQFNYGAVADAVVLTALVPVWTCEACGEHYLGEEAEDIMHDAVCAHLGRLSPRDIKAMRVAFGMRQDEFADFTGYGSASIKRWESGSQIQSESVDKHLRLLRSLGMIEALKRISSRPTPEFKKDFDSATRDQARRFSLRTSADGPKLELAA